MDPMQQQQMMADQLRQGQGQQQSQGQDPQAEQKAQQIQQTLSQMSSDDLYMVESIAASLLQSQGLPSAADLQAQQGGGQPAQAEQASLPPNGAM